MAERMPTQPGDVLILWTSRSFTTYVLGCVCQDGQQDFMTHQTNLQCLTNSASAMAQAKAIATPGRRIFLRNLDTGEWSEVSARDTTLKQAS